MDIHGRANLHSAGPSFCWLACPEIQNRSGSDRMPASSNPINHYGTFKSVVLSVASGGYRSRLCSYPPNKLIPKNSSS